MSVFTPGPWLAVRSLPAEGADCWWICAGGGNREKELAVVYAGPPTHIGNASLIAAAPDLFVALRAALAQLETVEVDELEGDGGDAFFDAMENARIALAKAEGSL